MSKSKYARTPNTSIPSVEEPRGVGSFVAPAVTAPKSRSFADRMRSQSQAEAERPVETEAASEHSPGPSSRPPALNTNGGELSIPALWGFDAEMAPPSTDWVICNCPKCAKKTPDVAHNSIQMEAAGGFFCSECGYNGNITLHPRQYRDTWLNVWRRYITDPRHSTLPPEDLPSTTVGCWADVWENHQWKTRWNSWCVFKDRVDDTFIYNDDLLSWSRPHFTVPMPYGMNDFAAERMVLTTYMEDMAALEAAGVKNVVCLPPDLDSTLSVSPAWRVLESMEKTMKDIKEVVLALRSTPAQRALEEELGRRLDRERCFRVRWRPDDDEVVQEENGPIDVLNQYGAATLQLMVEIAPPFPVIGVYELQDVEEKFDALYESGLVPGSSTGWPSVDSYYTVKTGQWTVVTGIPGHGKSSWLDGLLVNLASLHGWRFGLFSPENQPVERHFASLMEKKLKKPFSEGPVERITPLEKNKTKRWLNDRFKVILPDEEDGTWTLDAVLSLAKTLVYRYGIRGLVIDPWNELDHSRSSAANETSHISESLTKIRRFARLYDIHIWIVAHPTKLEKKANGKYPVATPYDISGGAHWRNKADNALSIYRNVGEIDDDVCDIYVQKIRFKEIGRVGMASLRSEKASGSYVDDIDHHKRALALNNKDGEHMPSSAMQTQERVYNPNVEGLEYDHSF